MRLNGCAVVLPSALALTLTLSLGSAGCTKPRHAQAQEDGGSAPSSSAAHVATTRGITTVDVPGDKRALVVPGNPSVHRPIVHLHGMCGDPRDDLEAWGAAAAKEHGTIVAVTGDVPCPDKPGRWKWSEDADAHDARIVAALDVVNAARGTSLDKSDILLVGESMGAARAELLATAKPERYARLVLVGSPQTPSPAKLRGVRAVANLAGEKEAQANMKKGAQALSAAGTPSQFWELPGATHGQYGPEGAAIMAEAIGFVATK